MPVRGPAAPCQRGKAPRSPRPNPRLPRPGSHGGPRRAGRKRPQAPQHVPPAAGPALPHSRPLRLGLRPRRPARPAPVCGSPAGAAPQAHTAPGGAQPPFWPGARHGAARLGRPAARPAQGPQAGRQAAPPYAAPGAVPPPARNVSPAPGVPPYAVPGPMHSPIPLGAAARAPYAGPHRRHAAGGGAAAGGVDCAADLGV